MKQINGLIRTVFRCYLCQFEYVVLTTVVMDVHSWKNDQSRVCFNFSGQLCICFDKYKATVELSTGNHSWPVQCDSDNRNGLFTIKRKHTCDQLLPTISLVFIHLPCFYSGNTLLFSIPLQNVIRMYSQNKQYYKQTGHSIPN